MTGLVGFQSFPSQPVEKTVMAKQRSTTEPIINESTPPKGKGAFKTMTMATLVLALEAALIVGAFLFFAGPGEVSAEDERASMSVEEQRISEIMLIDEQLTNDRLGSVYVYPVEIYVHVPEDEQPWFNDLVGQFHNEIRAEVTALWRSADPVALQDPRMDLVTSRVETLLRNRFEGEATPEHPRIRKVVIVCGTGFRVRG
jgi:hypothetical protein